MWSVEENTRTRTSSSPRAAARWASSSSSIWVLIALRASGRSRRSSATPARRLVVSRHRLPPRRSISVTRRPRAIRSISRSVSSAAPRSAPRPRPRARGSGRGRRRRRSRGRSSRGARRRPGRARSRGCRGPRLRLFSPLWPARPPPSLTLDLAERQVDLVVDHDHVVERHLAAPARRPGRVAGLVHVGLRQQQGHPRPARAGPALGDQAAVTLSSACGRSQRREQLGSRPRSRRCGGSPRIAPGVAEPDDRIRSPAARPRRARPAAEERRRLLPVGVARVALGRLAGLGGLLALGRLALLADQLGLLLELGLGLLLDPRRREGRDRDLLGLVVDEA